MVDTRVSNPSDLAAGLDLRGIRGAAGSPLVATNSIRVDVGHGPIRLEVCRLPNGAPVRGARELRERVYNMRRFSQT